MREQLDAYEYALAHDLTTFTPTRKETMDPNEMPSREQYEKGGGDPAKYDLFVESRKAELAGKALKAAETKATSVAKFRVKGTNWRQGQTHYTVPSKAPRDLRIQAGEPGHEPDWKAEPGIRLKIGAVTAVPIRDAAHLRILRDDANLEQLHEDTLTEAEEKEIATKAIEEARARGGSARDAKSSAENVEKVRLQSYVPSKHEWLKDGGRGDYEEFKKERIRSIRLQGLDAILGAEPDAPKPTPNDGKKK